MDDAPFGGGLHVVPRHYGGAMMRRLISNSHIVKSVHATAGPHKAASHPDWQTIPPTDSLHIQVHTVIKRSSRRQTDCNSKTQNPTDKHFCK